MILSDTAQALTSAAAEIGSRHTDIEQAGTELFALMLRHGIAPDSDEAEFLADSLGIAFYYGVGATVGHA